MNSTYMYDIYTYSIVKKLMVKRNGIYINTVFRWLKLNPQVSDVGLHHLDAWKPSSQAQHPNHPGEVVEGFGCATFRVPFLGGEPPNRNLLPPPPCLAQT